MASFLSLFYKCCKTEDLQHLWSETYVFEDYGPLVLHHLRYLFEAVLCVAVWVYFVFNFRRFWPPNGDPFEASCGIFCGFCMIFRGSVFEVSFGGSSGVGRRQWRGSARSKNLQNLVKIQSRPAPPAGVRRILRLRPCRRPLLNLVACCPLDAAAWDG